MGNPDGYVENQRQVNSVHSNGQPEGPDEEARGFAAFLSRFIKKHTLPCESILDAGCRLGYAMDSFVSEFPAARIVGLDIVPEFVEVADRRCEAILGDLQDLPFKDGEFDWIFCAATLEHCPEAALTASEIKRVARVGFYVSTDVETPEEFAANPSHYTRHGHPQEWMALFEGQEWWPVLIHTPTRKRLDLLYIRSEFKEHLQRAS